ncbi:PREDICTED: 3-oxoacyl-[acyl-carrier-protein] synthase II, chloroplastic-like isoform X1 [Camelina sativa]|uniref:beta-ketoacyl-[acyl-carrier-protein] synthase I n=1 Tax=Camelina sativa TaxID=90675 RepID=A0ABM0YB03_CAMSA|nr:PREDICTED: 3-oxoacyl-[acyl-carrier-protein] synthase II, chloroplastic-like isoform X1 [Camelina sativa]
MVAGASSSCYASPLCDWLVGACMSSGGDRLRQSDTKTSRRSTLLTKSKCSAFSSSTTNGSAGLVSNCNNNALSSLFFESNNNTYFNRKQRRLNQASSSGQVTLEMEKEATVKKKPPLESRRVVVTGMGVETPLGHDPHTFYDNLLQGISGISPIENFDCSAFPTRIAGEIKTFSTEGLVAPKLSKRMDKFMLYLLTAGKKALADGGVTEDVMAEFDKSKCGVLIGSAMGGMKVFYDALEALKISYKKMNPFCVPFATTNMGSAMLAIDLGWMGPNYSISTACATGNFCILSAANHIIRGEADVMLCGGSDSVIIPIGLGGFVACRALSENNDDPTKASRPWDSNRDGFVMGEGAGVLLLEELEHAKSRGATIYAEFLGGSFTSDAYHITEPHPDGAGVILCIEKALAHAGISKEDVNYINAHATSTPAGDLKEYQALAHCFGQNPELKINSTKSMIGHLLGASGAVEAVATIQAIKTGWVHPNINLENPDKAVDTKLLVGLKKERLDIKAALSNSFGFGGHNSCIIFAPYK